MKLTVDSCTDCPAQFPSLPQLEDYHIIARDAEHLLVIFCHGMPEAHLNGALVLSRSGQHCTVL